jgi:uncharacterized protein YraI/GH25 family lysozyme M1 (1,4-beta-N-acetylmuramidase)
MLEKAYKIVMILIAMVILPVNVLAYQDDSVDNQNNSAKEKQTLTQVENQSDKNNETSLIAEENSWRYKDGQSIKPKQRVVQYTTWPKLDKAIAYGIDVSYHNGIIDWAKVKQSGVDFAIIRCGYGINSTSQDDKQWQANVEGCIKNDIPFGVYLYSYADNVSKAKSEAEHVLRLVKGYDLAFPIYYDLEESDIRSNVSKTGIADIAKTFCDAIEKAEYEVGIYANKDWFTNYLTDNRFNQWDRWIAQYNTSCTYTGKYSIWQCSSEGKVDGINGLVDLNIDFDVERWGQWIGYNPKRYGDVKTSTILRSEAKTGSQLIEIPAGERVLLDGYQKFTDASWYKTSYKGKTGYVLSTDLKLSYQAYEVKIAGETTDNMYLRSGVGLNYTKKVYIPKNTKITLQGYYRTEGYDWYYVEYNGVNGYVSSKYVKRLEEPFKWIEYNPKRYGDVKTSTVLRSEAKTGSQLVEIPVGERILLDGYKKFADTSWYKTSYKGKIGYVLSTDLKLSYLNYESKVMGTTTANMYMRSGVGLHYTKKIYIPKNTQIILHGYYHTEGYDWYYVEYKGVKGYVSSQYVKRLKDPFQWIGYNPERYGDVKTTTFLRSEAKTGSQLIKIPAGERILLDGYKKFADTSWYKASYKGKTGYVLAKNLKLSYQVYTPKKVGKTTVNMYMRSGVGLNYTKKTYIPKNTKITLYGYYRTEGYDWYYVGYNGIKGYVSSRYVRRQ